MPALQTKNAPASRKRSGAGHQEVSPVPEEIYKACSRCGEDKPLSAFHTDKRTSDGRRSECRACSNKARRKYDRENRHLVNARKRRWYARHPEDHARYRATWAAKNPEKHVAHVAVRVAVDAGRLVAPDHCELCAETKDLHAHHDDYSKPLEVRWLCPVCHKQVHKELDATEEATP